MRMIFHLPFEPDKNRLSASQIRPYKMISAFQHVGYEVALVIGSAKTREGQIKHIEKRILNGENFDFLYSESSTMPTMLTESHHLPTYPFLDFGFFEFCKIHNVKIGLFYRDIYWLFDEYGKSLSFIKRNLAKFFYRYDLKKYNDLVDIIYLPSMQMAKYIPTVSQNKFKALPPGHDEDEGFASKAIKETIELLYIGGLGSHYQMQKLFSVLKNFPNIHFTLCTRENEWQNAKAEYELSENIFIVHKSGDELKDLYQNADIAMLFVKPQEYREFAAPVKLYEYIGKEKPIIASRGTLAGAFVEENDIGWNLEYEEKVLEKFFEKLQDESNIINLKKENLKLIKINHSWEARAKEVEKGLLI